MLCVILVNVEFYQRLICNLHRAREEGTFEVELSRGREDVREGGGTLVGENWKKKNVANETVPIIDNFLSFRTGWCSPEGSDCENIELVIFPPL